MIDFDTLLISLLAVLIIILLLKNRRSSENEASQNIIQNIQQIREEIIRSSSDHRKEVQTRLDRVNDQVTKGLGDSNLSMQKQFSETAKIITDVTKHLTELEKTNSQVLNFSEQLQGLQDILKNPKQRGVLGEYWLETLLGNVLPPGNYKMQYSLGFDAKLNQKLIADAVIIVRDQIIPIDAKFSLENYNRMIGEHDKERKDKLEKEFKADIKKRIDETSKYIRREFSTMDFAFMFIPAEGVYYNLLNIEIGAGSNANNLVEYAFQKKVMLVSPTSLYAYLQTVLLGLRELKFEESASDIVKQVGELGKHFRSYSDHYDKLGKHLNTAISQYNQSTDELRKLSKDVNKITNSTAEDVILLEKIQPSVVD